MQGAGGEVRRPLGEPRVHGQLPDSGFYDLWHLVEPGRKVWQSLLSARTAALLEQYGYDGGGS